MSDPVVGRPIGADLTNTAPDTAHLHGLVDRGRERRAVVDLPIDEATTVGAVPRYFSTDTITEDGDGIDLRIAAASGHLATAVLPKSGGWPTDVFSFDFDVVRNVWAYRAGKLLVRQVTPPDPAGRPTKDRYHGTRSTVRHVCSRRGASSPVRTIGCWSHSGVVRPA
jgi:hypothetical protein